MTWTFDNLVNLMNFLANTALKLGAFVAAGFIIYYGARMAMSRGEAGHFETAKNNLFKVFLGALVLFGAWTIVRTLEAAVDSALH